MFRFRVAVPLFAALIVATLPVAAQPKTGTQFFYDYHAAIVKGNSFNDIVPFLSKAERAKLAEMSADEQKSLWDVNKQAEAMMKDLKVVKETPTADGAILDVTGIGPGNTPFKAKVKLVKEGGAWKWSGEDVSM